MVPGSLSFEIAAISQMENFAIMQTGHGALALCDSTRIVCGFAQNNCEFRVDFYTDDVLSRYYSIQIGAQSG
jgi:hypothetical protein